MLLLLLLLLLPSVAAECGMEPKSGRCKNMFLKSKKGELFVFSCQAQAVRCKKPAKAHPEDPQSTPLAAPRTRF